MKVYVSKVCNTYGKGYEFNHSYTAYGYTYKEAEKLFRNKYGLKGKHIDFIKMWEPQNTLDGLLKRWAEIS